MQEIPGISLKGTDSYWGQAIIGNTYLYNHQELDLI